MEFALRSVHKLGVMLKGKHRHNTQMIFELIIRPLLNILKEIIRKIAQKIMGDLLVTIGSETFKAIISAGGGPSPPDPTPDLDDADDLEASEVYAPLDTEDDGGGGDEGFFVETFSKMKTKFSIPDSVVEAVVPKVVEQCHSAILKTTQQMLKTAVSQESNEGIRKEAPPAIVRSLSRTLLTCLTHYVPIVTTKAVIKELSTRMIIDTATWGTQNLLRELSFSLTLSLTHAFTRNPVGDYACQDCTSSGKGCDVCQLTKLDDHYTVHYATYYAGYFERYYSFYYGAYYARIFAEKEVDDFYEGGGGDGGGGE